MTVQEIYLTTNIRKHFARRHITDCKILNKIYLKDYIKALRKLRGNK